MKTHRMILSDPECNEGESKDTSLYTQSFYFFMWFVYILLCSDNSFYTGISDNPQKRFLDHKNGKGGRYTRLHKPTKILYLEQFTSKSEALKRELQIKDWSRGKKIKILKLNI